MNEIKKEENKSEELKLFEIVESLRTTAGNHEELFIQVGRDLTTLDQKIMLLKAELDRLRNQFANFIIEKAIDNRGETK